MAESGFEHGSMDINEHQKQWEAFLSIAKWSSAAAIIVLALMAIFLT